MSSARKPPAPGRTPDDRPADAWLTKNRIIVGMFGPSSTSVVAAPSNARLTVPGARTCHTCQAADNAHAEPMTMPNSG